MVAVWSGQPSPQVPSAEGKAKPGPRECHLTIVLLKALRLSLPPWACKERRGEGRPRRAVLVAVILATPES